MSAFRNYWRTRRTVAWRREFHLTRVALTWMGLRLLSGRSIDGFRGGYSRAILHDPNRVSCVRAPAMFDSDRVMIAGTVAP
jgi:hypothetical protein